MNLRLLKSKIKSIGSVGQITKALELVSAVKMRKAQDKALSTRPYKENLQSTIDRVVAGVGSLESPLFQKNLKIDRRLAIVVSSNKGMCGVFHFNLLKYLVSETADFTKTDFIVLGTKAQQFILHYGGQIVADFSFKMPYEQNVSAIFNLIKEQFLAQKYQSVDLFYNRFVSSMVFIPTKKTLLPIDLQAVAKITEQTNKQYTLEPQFDRVLTGLLDFYLENEIRGSIAESAASEHSARMIAMKNATDNSKELVYSLTLMRNQIRQEKITNELLDMNTSKLAVS